jgi:hypothetical protein
MEGLLILRPLIAPGQVDRIFLAVARALHVTPQRLEEVVDGLKKQLPAK